MDNWSISLLGTLGASIEEVLQSSLIRSLVEGCSWRHRFAAGLWQPGQFFRQRTAGAAVSSGPGVHDKGKAWGARGGLWHICHTRPFRGHCTVTVLVCMETKAIVSLLENAACVTKCQKRIWHIPVKVTSVAKWSSVLLGPLRDDIKHASELSRPRGEEAWGFSFRFNHYQLGIAPRVFAWYSHLPVHRLRGGPQVENCRCWQREEWWVRALLLSPTPAVAGAAVMTVVPVARGGGDLFVRIAVGRRA